MPHKLSSAVVVCALVLHCFSSVSAGIINDQDVRTGLYDVDYPAYGYGLNAALTRAMESHSPFDDLSDGNLADFRLKRSRGVKRPKGNWRDVLEEMVRNQDKLDFSRLKNVRFGLGR